MVEVALEEFEDFYKERLNSQFFKIKKVSKKLISDIRDSLIAIKVTMDHFQESAAQKIDIKALRSLKLFYERVKIQLMILKFLKKKI